MADMNPHGYDSATITSTRLRALLRYWTEKRGDLPMALRAQIDPVEIPRTLSVVLLADVTPAGPRIRLLGTEATNAYGRETRGRLARDIQFGGFDVAWQEAFDQLIQSAAPVFAAGDYLRGTEPCGVETILLPLTADGHSVSQIFGGLIIKPRNRGMMTENKRRSFFVSGAGELDSRQAEPHRN